MSIASDVDEYGLGLPPPDSSLTYVSDATPVRDPA